MYKDYPVETLCCLWILFFLRSLGGKSLYSKYVTIWKVVQEEKNLTHFITELKLQRGKVMNWTKVSVHFKTWDHYLSTELQPLFQIANINLQWSNRIKNEGGKMELSAKRAFWKVTQLEKMFLQWDENVNSGSAILWSALCRRANCCWYKAELAVACVYSILTSKRRLEIPPELGEGTLFQTPIEAFPRLYEP